MVRKLSYLICFVFVAMLFMSANASAVTLVDNFETYSLGLVKDVASPPWTEGFNKGGAASRIDGDPYLVLDVVSNTNQTEAVWTGVTAIPNTDTQTTLYLRFRAETATANASFGLTDMAVPVGYKTGSFSEYANQMRVSVQAGLLAFDVRNGGAFTAVRYAVNVGEWYNVWAVINNSTDRFDVYMNQGTASATVNDLKYANIAFRKGSVAPLVTFMGMTQGGPIPTADNLPFDLDEIYLTPGQHLGVPEPATMILLGLGSLALLKRRKS